MNEVNIKSFRVLWIGEDERLYVPGTTRYRYYKDFCEILDINNIAIKEIFCNALKDISKFLNIYTWHIEFNICNELYFRVWIDLYTDNNEPYHSCAFFKKEQETGKIKFKKLLFPLIDMEDFKSYFIDYIKKCSLFHVNHFPHSGEFKDSIKVLDDKLRSDMKYLNELFNYEYSGYFKEYKTSYLIGDQVYIARGSGYTLIESDFNIKMILKDMIENKNSPIKLSAESIEVIFDSDDIKGIVENIKLLAY